MLLKYVQEDLGTRYPPLLAAFTKRALNDVLPIRAARKADAIDVIVRLDRLALAKAADRSMQIVLAETTDPARAQVVQMQDAVRQQKGQRRKWTKLARRKLKSQQMIRLLKRLIASPEANRMTVDKLRAEVGKLMDVDIDATTRPNLLAFFHKHLQRLLAKTQKKPARKRRRQLIFNLADGDAMLAWGESQSMWAEDEWPLKFALMADRQEAAGHSGSR